MTQAAKLVGGTNLIVAVNDSTQGLECRGDESLPADPRCLADFQALGCELNGLGQFVEKGNLGEFLDYFYKSSERANEVHKEAVHTSARKEVIERMGELGVEELLVDASVRSQRAGTW